MDSPVRRLEVGKNFPRIDKGVVRLVPLELLDPCVFYHTDDEFTTLAPRVFECRVVAAPGLVYCLLLVADRCLPIVID